MPKKIELNELTVKSFVVNLQEKQKIMGGIHPMSDCCPPPCAPTGHC